MAFGVEPVLCTARGCPSLRASVPTTCACSSHGVRRAGHIDKRAQAEAPSARWAERPMQILDGGPVRMVGSSIGRSEEPASVVERVPGLSCRKEALLDKPPKELVLEAHGLATLGG